MSAFRTFLKDESGTATIEFLFVFPILFTIFTASFESSMYMARHVMFERAVDLTVRQLRLGTMLDPSHLVLKQTICRSGMMVDSIDNCVKDMRIWMQPIDTGSFAMPAPPRHCIDRANEINTDDPPASTFAYGEENEIMLLRICLKVDPMFPTTAVSVKMPVEPDGSRVLLVTSTFVNEPG
jgi:TadE-like protein